MKAQIKLTKNRDNHFVIDGVDIAHCVSMFHITGDAHSSEIGIDLSIGEFEFDSDAVTLKINNITIPESLRPKIIQALKEM